MAALAWLLAACLPVTPPTIKIALVAPFEGRYRQLGYEVIHSVRLAVREANSAQGAGGYGIELVALDDGGSPAGAEEQARKLAADPAVLGVIGHWLETTTQAAAVIYAREGLPMLATAAGPLPADAFRLWPEQAQFEAAAADAGGAACLTACLDLVSSQAWLAAAGPGASVGPPLWGMNEFRLLLGAQAQGVRVLLPAPLPADAGDPGFTDRYTAVSGTAPPGAFGVLAYDAARLLLTAIAQDSAEHGRPTPSGVSAALSAIDVSGLSGQISFDQTGRWSSARAWVYEWHDGALRRP